MLFFNYEELTSYDFHLTQQYFDPGGPPTVSGHRRTFTPPELIKDVSRAYFRLAQHNKIDAWFEDRGFDLEKPISKEEFEKHLADESTKAATPKITKADARDFAINYFNSAARPTMDDCEIKWPHGSRARKLLRIEYRKEAESRGIPVKPGPRGNSAK
jgi:hypothetical protein